MAIGSIGFRRTQTGATYLALLFLVAVLSIVATSASSLWVTVNARSKERELLFIGAQFREAIKQYYLRTPGTVKRYPATLSDLLKDDRQLQLTRYLRRIYLDPLTGRAEWGIVRGPGGGIIGVYSLGPGRPFKQGNFDDENAEFVDATSYANWWFVYLPEGARAD